MSSRPPISASQAKIHGPLDEAEAEIRILVIEAGEPQDAVQCQLQTISLVDGCETDYETMSYCWGDAAVRGSVVIGDISIDVPASSEASLRATRSVDCAKAVWIDALCINQVDMAEKESQIAHMDRVYQRGKHNNIYLGDDHDAAAKEAFEAVRRLATKIRQDAPESSDNEREEWTLRGYLPRAWVLSNTMSREDKSRMQRLLHLPWFKLWTMQEFALARSNVCIWGGACIDLKDVVVAADFYVASFRSSPVDFDMEAGRIAAAVHSFTRLAEDARQTAEPYDFDLRTRYETITSRSATDPRDHVFGLVGLLRAWKKWDDLPELLRPDYHKTDEQVFRDATRAVLEMDGDAILAHVRFALDAELDKSAMPTWAVRWDTPLDRSHTSTSGSSVALPPESNAGNGLGERQGVSMKHVIIDPDVLEVKGFFLETIDWVSTPLKHVMSDLTSACFGSMDDLIETIIRRASTREDNFFQMSQKEMAMLVLSGDRWDYGPYGLRSLHDAIDAYTNLKAFIVENRRMPNTQDGNDLSSGFRFFRMLQAHSRVISLADGHVGLGPQISQVGDRLFVMDGGLYPYVLRVCGDDWRLVGAALVHRAMHGEVYNMGIEPEWIRIR